MGKDERKMTPCASETVSRLAVQLGSFKEARGGRPGAHESHVCRCGKAGDAPVRLGNARADAKAETQIHLAHALPAGPANCGSGVTGLKPNACLVESAFATEASRCARKAEHSSTK